MNRRLRFVLIVIMVFAAIFLVVKLFRLKKERLMVHPLELVVGTERALTVAGELLLNSRKSASYKVGTKGKTAEGYNDIVTSSDIISHNYLKEFFSSYYPHLTFLSEEDYVNVETKLKTVSVPPPYTGKYRTYTSIPQDELFVVVDPLDATQEFSEDLLDYVSVMACFFHGKHPFLGMVHFPKFGETFYALQGGHRSSNFNSVSKIFNFSTLPNTNNKKIDHKLIYSRSHAGNILQVAKRSNAFNISMTAAGGAGYKSVLVAGKAMDTYIHLTTIKLWDVCSALVFSSCFEDLQALDLKFSPLTADLVNPRFTNGFVLTRDAKKLEKILSH